MKNVDVIIVSWAKDENLRNVTKQGLDSLFKSNIKDDLKFNAIIVESNKSVDYNEYNNNINKHTCKTIHPIGKFNYNDYLNQGLFCCNSEYVVLCNSDLIYERGWADYIIDVMIEHPSILSASPWCPSVHGDNKNNLNKVFIGHTVRFEFCGWCIFQQRQIYDLIGELNTAVDFWFSDNILADELLLRNIDHALIPKSVVHHHDKNIGKTGDTLDYETKQKYTAGQYDKYLSALNMLKMQLE